MDILYPLGGGSVWDNNELRYSLRSVEKYLTGVTNVYIVGKKPPFLKDVIEVDYVDATPFKEYNIFKKVEYASLSVPELSEDFLFMNDDHFLLFDFNCYTFPYFYLGSLADTIARKYGEGKYKRALVNTKRELEARRFPILNYDGHQPIIYNKRNIVELGKMYEWSDVSYVLKSLYGNTFAVNGTYEPDCKISGMYYLDQLKELIRNKKVFSIGNPTIQPDPSDFKQLVDYLYPKPSKWEIV